jgi:hypothetical protein
MGWVSRRSSEFLSGGISSTVGGISIFLGLHSGMDTPWAKSSVSGFSRVVLLNTRGHREIGSDSGQVRFGSVRFGFLSSGLHLQKVGFKAV